MKSLPKRTCIGCNTTKNKSDLIRIVKGTDDNISIDKTGKASGRGAYICNNVQCLEKAIKSKKLEKSFEINIKKEIYEDIRGVMIDE